MNQRIQKQNIREKYWRYSLYVILLGLGTVIFVELIPFLGGLLGALTIYVLPFSSEVVLVILVRMGLDPLLCLFAAASGNTLGGMTCYWIGHLGKRDWITRYLRVEPAKIDRVSRFLEGKGALFAFFTFLPYVGEAVAIVLGLMRSNVWITAVAMFVGKLLRYVAIVAALQGVLSWF